jgi:hypothetical protein
MPHTDPYFDHVLNIAGIDPTTAGAAALDPLVVAANMQAAALAQQYAPAPAQLAQVPQYAQLAQVPPVYAPPPPICYEWPTVALAAGAGLLVGYLFGSRA